MKWANTSPKTSILNLILGFKIIYTFSQFGKIWQKFWQTIFLRICQWLVLASEMKEMLKMAKNNKNKRIKKTNEKQVGARLKGFDFSDFDTYDVTGIDVFRFGLINLEEEKKSNPLALKKMKLLSEIKFIKDRMHERELSQFADELLLEKLNEQLANIKGFSDEKRNQLIKAIEKIYYEFIDDESIDEDIRCDISQFYVIKRHDIDIYAMKVGIRFEDAVIIFDEYLDEINEQTIVDDTIIDEINK